MVKKEEDKSFNWNSMNSFLLSLFFLFRFEVSLIGQTLMINLPFRTFLHTCAFSYILYYEIGRRVIRSLITSEKLIS